MRSHARTSSDATSTALLPLRPRGTPAPRPGPVTGRVLDDATGRPLAGAVIALGHDALRRLAPRPARTCTTGEDGGFAFERAASGEALLARCEGFLPELVELAAGAAPLEVRLAPGGAVTGDLLDDRGAPLAGVRVVALSRGAVDVREATTDAAGRFALTGLRPGRYIVTPADGALPVAALPALVRPGAVALAPLRVPPAGHGLTVRPLDARGRPCSAEALLVPGEVGPLPTFDALLESGPVRAASGDPRAPSFARVAPGRYTLVLVRETGRGEPDICTRPVDVAGDGLLEVRLPDAGPGSEL
jgi:hypothetical protein